MEPLGTDEKLTSKAKRPQSMDDLMVMGCSGFVFASVATYLLTIWPFFVFQEAYVLRTLWISCAFGMIPAAILGGLSARRFGLPGACGFVAGAVTTGVFLNLRVEQIFLAAAAKQTPFPDYPESFRILLPAGWLLVSVALAILALPRGEKADIDAIRGGS